MSMAIKAHEHTLQLFEGAGVVSALLSVLASTYSFLWALYPPDCSCNSRGLQSSINIEYIICSINLVVEGTEEPVGRSWHTLTKISEYQLLLYGGFTQEQTVLSKYM